MIVEGIAIDCYYSFLIATLLHLRQAIVKYHIIFSAKAQVVGMAQVLILGSRVGFHDEYGATKNPPLAMPKKPGDYGVISQRS